MSTPRLVVALVAALTTSVLTGCGSGSGTGESATPSVEVPTVPQGQAPLTQDGAWWAGGVLHLGDRSLKVGAVTSFAVADRTVVYADGSDHVCFTDLERHGCSDLETAGDLVVSPDGQHVGFLESAQGEHDDYDFPQWTITVLDLDTGEVDLSSTAGMGDPDTDDLGALYGDASNTFLGFSSEGDAVVDAASAGGLLLPLDGGEPGQAHLDDLAVRDLPGQTIRVDRSPSGTVTRIPGGLHSSDEAGQLSPDGQDLVLGPLGVPGGLLASSAPPGRLERFTGQEGTFSTLGPWAGPHSVLASARARGQRTHRVYLCDAAARTCELQDEVSTDAPSITAVVFPTTTGTDVLSFDP